MPHITWQQDKTICTNHFTSFPFNGPGGAAIRANGLRHECVNDYSPGVGSSPSQVDRSRSFPLFLFFLCPRSVTRPLTVLHPFYSTDPCLTGCFPTCHWPVWDSFPLNLQDQAVCHRAGRSLSTLWSKLFTASSTWWRIFPSWPHSFVLSVCSLIFLFATLKLRCSAQHFHVVWSYFSW